jgi:hypothetical protein
MSGNRLIIRKTGPPTRCEICHLSDQFDFATESCRRCAGVTVPAATAKTAITQSPPLFIDRVSHLLGISFFIMICSSVCLLFSLSFLPTPLLVIFSCLTVMLVISTIVLFACYCCYWTFWTVAWIARALGRVFQKID